MSFRGSAASRGIYSSGNLYLVLVHPPTWWIPPLRYAAVGMTFVFGFGRYKFECTTIPAPGGRMAADCRRYTRYVGGTFLRIRQMLRQGLALPRGGLISQGLRPDSFPGGGEAFSPAPCVFWSPGAPPRQRPECRRPHRTRWYRYHRWRAFRRRFCFRFVLR